MFHAFDDEGFADLSADVLWGAFHCDPVTDVQGDTWGLVGDSSTRIHCHLVDSHLWIFVLLNLVNGGVGGVVTVVGDEVVDLESSFEIFTLAGAVGFGVAGAVGLSDCDFVEDVTVVVGEDDVGVFDFADARIVGESGLRCNKGSGPFGVSVDEPDFAVD